MVAVHNDDRTCFYLSEISSGITFRCPSACEALAFLNSIFPWILFSWRFIFYVLFFFVVQNYMNDFSIEIIKIYRFYINLSYTSVVLGVVI